MLAGTITSQLAALLGLCTDLWWVAYVAPIAGSFLAALVCFRDRNTIGAIVAALVASGSLVFPIALFNASLYGALFALQVSALVAIWLIVAAGFAIFVAHVVDISIHVIETFRG